MHRVSVNKARTQAIAMPNWTDPGEDDYYLVWVNLVDPGVECTRACTGEHYARDEGLYLPNPSKVSENTGFFGGSLLSGLELLLWRSLVERGVNMGKISLVTLLLYGLGRSGRMENMVFVFGLDGQVAVETLARLYEPVFGARPGTVTVVDQTARDGAAGKDIISSLGALKIFGPAFGAPEKVDDPLTKIEDHTRDCGLLGEKCLLDEGPLPMNVTIKPIWPNASGFFLVRGITINVCFPLRILAKPLHIMMSPLMGNH